MSRRRLLLSGLLIAASSFAIEWGVGRLATADESGQVVFGRIDGRTFTTYPECTASRCCDPAECGPPDEHLAVFVGAAGVLAGTFLLTRRRARHLTSSGFEPGYRDLPSAR